MSAATHERRAGIDYLILDGISVALVRDDEGSGQVFVEISTEDATDPRDHVVDAGGESNPTLSVALNGGDLYDGRAL